MDKIIYEEQLQYLNSLKKRENDIFSEMEEYAQLNRIPILDKNSVGLFKQILAIKKPRTFLEIGTAIAYSALVAASVLNEKVIVETIEKSKDNVVKAKRYIEKSEFGKQVKILEGDALSILPKLKKKYDFVFLDADKEDYIDLFGMIVPIIKKNGILFVDNLLWHGYAAKREIPEKYIRGAENIREFNQILLNSSEFESEIYTIGDGIGIGIKKS